MDAGSALRRRERICKHPLRARGEITCAVRPPMHPGLLRCSSVTGRRASSLVAATTSYKGVGNPGASAAVFAHLISPRALRGCLQNINS